MLAASKLPAASPLREVAKAVCVAMEASDDLHLAVDSDCESAELKSLYSGGRQALAELEACLLSGETEDPNSAAAVVALREALEMATSQLQEASEDVALRNTLMSAPWNQHPPSLLQIREEEIRRLQTKAFAATPEGRAKFAQELKAALEASGCAGALWEAMEGADTQALAARIQDARDLGFSDLELAEQQLQDLQASEQMRRAKLIESSHSSMQPEDGWLQETESSNLIFLDLELTAGHYDFDLVPKVLEVAAVITDKDLRELGRGSWVVGGFTREELDGLGFFHQEHFRDRASGGAFPPLQDFGGGGNGLFSEVVASTLTKEEVEDQLLGLVHEHCPPGACPLVGYSVQCDREVLKSEMPRLYRYVSHQIVDITGFFRLARTCLPNRVREEWDKRVSRYDHRAINDVEESIAALRWVRKSVFERAAIPTAEEAERAAIESERAASKLAAAMR